MGYAGYAPGNKVADSLTPLQQALRSLPLEHAQEILDLIEKLTRNVVRNPGEEKFRSVKLTNKTIAAAIEAAPTMVDVMQEMGWVRDGDCLVLPPSIRLAHEVHVVGVIDAKDHFKKEAENEHRRKLRAGKAADADKEELLRKMDLDRQEKQADGPVTQGSVAKKLGEGPNIMALATSASARAAAADAKRPSSDAVRRGEAAGLDGPAAAVKAVAAAASASFFSDPRDGEALRSDLRLEDPPCPGTTRSTCR
eukprot:CAMPEP_0198494690 /NCGR_PEP_ID=MMETSP1462-20131121/4768_1 /TAXON_ID=1333877 /ORGANISM="Brandtodinium nutriculum, Strain RCC3387" /LENGTH=251 /DNA_ID=CAMNT_0044223435 /DNA_START=91 /DNA_END=843 /DNA_ORIENTATION=-